MEIPVLRGCTAIVFVRCDQVQIGGMVDQQKDQQKVDMHVINVQNILR